MQVGVSSWQLGGESIDRHPMSPSHLHHHMKSRVFHHTADFPTQSSAADYGYELHHVDWSGNLIRRYTLTQLMCMWASVKLGDTLVMQIWREKLTEF